MSGKQRAQFDFGRYGQILLGIALLLGLYLARHAGSCVKESFSAYQLRGESSESSAGVIAGESGRVESSQSYYNGGGEGATGVFSFMMSATSYCTTTSSFRDPVFAYYGFLGSLGLGVLLIAAGRFIGPSWRKGVREQARTSQARKTSVDRPTDAADQRRPNASPPPGERYRVTGQHAAISGSIEVDLQSSSGKMLEDMLEPTSLTGVRATGNHTSLTSRSTASTPAPRFEAPPAPAPPPAQPAARAPEAPPSPAPRASGAHLAALGLGSVDDLLGDSSGLGSAVDMGLKPGGRSALDMILSFGSVELPESSRVPGLSNMGGASGASGLAASGIGARVSTPVPAQSTPAPSDETFSLEMDGWEDEEEEELGHQEGIDFDALFAAGEERLEVPSGTPFPGSSLGEAALKAPVLGDRMATSSLPLAAGYQSLIPAMETGMRRLYVAPLSAGARGKGSGVSQHDPLIGLEPALARARGYAQRGERVEVRLLPGIYREHLKLPPNTLLVNDAVPLELGRPERLAWLASDAAKDTARHVVIALPTHAEPDEAALELLHASDSTLVGVHIAGRSLLGEEAASGVGVRIEGSQRVTLRLCAIVGHMATEPGAGVQILQSGGSADADVIFLEDCLIYQNTTVSRGGGLYASGSSVHLDGCVIQDNLAHIAGGGLYLEDTRARAELSQCHIEGNRVECPGGLPATSSAGWGGEEGHGGGIFLRMGELSLRNVLLAANQAAGAGGGLYAASAVVTMEGEGQGARVTGNRALRGGGVLMCGFEDDEGVTALRAGQVHFVNNSAEESGGGLALFRLVQVELRRCVLTRNIARATHSEGGAIHATVGSRVRLEHTRIHQNAAGYRGGGLSICNSSLRIMDSCEVTGNRTLRGDSGGLAVYTMASSFVDVLKNHPRLELPFVCALAPCHIADNTATRGVGGLFVGSFDKTPAYSIACVVKDAAAIIHNTVATDRPVRSPNLTLVWEGRVVGNDARPPVGRKTLE